MVSVMINDAAEYNAATDRVNSALQLLRDEMKSLRHQDVTLMRQLIGINEKIRSISTEQRSAKNKTRHQRNKSISLSASLNSTTPCLKWQTPILRQQSAPRLCDVIPEERERRCSTSSNDDSQDEESCSEGESSLIDSNASLSDDSDDGEMTSAVPVFRHPALIRHRSHSMRTLAHRVPRGNSDGKLEIIFQKNIDIWKKAQRSLEVKSADLEVPSDNESTDL